MSWHVAPDGVAHAAAVAARVAARTAPLRCDHGALMPETEFVVTCPYCGEDVEIYLEPDTRGTLVQDCEVCCNPWQLRVTTDGDDRYVDISRADGSE